MNKSKGVEKEETYSSKCPKCGGRLKSIGTRFSTRWKLVTRTRECIKCEYKFKTAEVNFNDFQRQEVLIRALEMSISEYLNKPVEVQK